MKLPQYFREKDDVIEKVVVCYDKKELEKLKYEIADNCTLIVHREVDGTKKDKPDILMCESFSQKEIGISSSKAYECAPDEKLYHFSYDERVLPRLVKLIMELEKGNASIVEEIFESIDEEPNYDERIKKLTEEIDNISNADFDLKIEKLQELKTLTKEKERNKNVKSDIIYCDRLQELLDLIVIDSIPKKDILRVQKFFDLEYPPSEDLDYTKFIEKDKIKEKRL